MRYLLIFPILLSLISCTPSIEMSKLETSKFITNKKLHLPPQWTETLTATIASTPTESVNNAVLYPNLTWNDMGPIIKTLVMDNNPVLNGEEYLASEQFDMVPFEIRHYYNYLDSYGWTIVGGYLTEPIYYSISFRRFIIVRMDHCIETKKYCVSVWISEKTNIIPLSITKTINR